jgi:hypothetical protein
MKINIAMKGWEILNVTRWAENKLLRGTESIAHRQSLTQQK